MPSAFVSVTAVPPCGRGGVRGALPQYGDGLRHAGVHRSAQGEPTRGEPRLGRRDPSHRERCRAGAAGGRVLGHGRHPRRHRALLADRRDGAGRVATAAPGAPRTACSWSARRWNARRIILQSRGVALGVDEIVDLLTDRVLEQIRDVGAVAARARANCCSSCARPASRPPSSRCRSAGWPSTSRERSASRLRRHRQRRPGRVGQARPGVLPAGGRAARRRPARTASRSRTRSTGSPPRSPPGWRRSPSRMHVPLPASPAYTLWAEPRGPHARRSRRRARRPRRSRAMSAPPRRRARSSRRPRAADRPQGPASTPSRSSRARSSTPTAASSPTTC